MERTFCQMRKRLLSFVVVAINGRSGWQVSGLASDLYHFKMFCNVRCMRILCFPFLHSNSGGGFVRDDWVNWKCSWKLVQGQDLHIQESCTCLRDAFFGIIGIRRVLSPRGINPSEREKSFLHLRQRSGSLLGTKSHYDLVEKAVISLIRLSGKL
jgi:hypothetical protein